MYRVLLVDDEEIIKIGLRSMVNWEELGFEIVGTAENGIRALEMVKQLSPDVVITDLYMPVMDGFELISRLKQMGTDCEIIVLSNYGDVDNVKKAIKLGAEDYILKVSYDQKKFKALLDHLKEKLTQKGSLSGKQVVLGDERNYTGEEMKNFLWGTGEPLYGCEKHRYQLFMLVLPVHIVKLEDYQYGEVIKKITTVAQEALSDYEWKYFMLHKRNVFCVAVDSQNTELSDRNTLYIKLQKTLALYLMVHCSVLYEYNIRGIFNLKETVDGAEKNLDLVFWKSGCFKISEIKLNSMIDILNISKSVSRYWGYVKNSDFERLRYELNNVLHNFSTNLVKPEEVKQFFLILFSNIQVFIYQEYGEAAFPRYKIQETAEAEELRTILHQFVDFLEEYLKYGRLQAVNLPVADKIKHYINDHLEDKLRVNEIAELFHLHPNYLSSYFKEQTGMTLISYINQQKMEYAKKLLITKNYQIKEVAGMVGIEDPFYFNKLFKGYFGCAPSKLDENH